jgi:hypothetical protein
MPQIGRQYLLIHDIEGHLYLQRASNEYFVWLGLRVHIQALTKAQIADLVAYRLDFDDRCCRQVN